MVPYFYVRTLERVHIALADVFNNIYVNKYSNVERNRVVKTVKVPCVIGHYDKNFANFIRNVQKKRNVPVPIIGLRYMNATPRRSDMPQPHYIRTLYSRSNDQVMVDAQPIPHDITFSVDIFTESWSDYGQILENIAPYFTPFRTLRIKEFQECPDLERKVYAYLDSPSAQITDEYQRGSQRREINENITITCKCDFYRPRSVGKVIHYAELNIDKDQQLGNFPIQLQAFAYPTDLIEEIRQPWESVSESNVPGYSILSSYSGLRDFSVPNFLELDLDFDTDTDFEVDNSLYERNFTFVSDPAGSSRTYDPSMEPDGGLQMSGSGYGTDFGYEMSEYLKMDRIDIANNVIHLTKYPDLEVNAPVRVEEAPSTENVGLPGGLIAGTYYVRTADGNGNYTLSSTAGGAELDITSTGDAIVYVQHKWNRLLSWFGTNDGLMERPYSFKMAVRFDENPITGAVFQSVNNKQIGEPGDEVFYPASSVWYIWGIDDNNKLYFTIRTYGTSGLSWTFRTTEALSDLNNTSVYNIEFLLYGEGNEGVHLITTDDGQQQVLETERVPIGS